MAAAELWSAVAVYGEPSDRVRRLLAEKAEMRGDDGKVAIHHRQAGFIRRARVNTTA